MPAFEVFLWWFKNRDVFQSPAVRAQPRALSEPAITTHGRAAAVMSQAISRAPTAAISPVARLSLLSFPLAAPSLYFFFFFFFFLSCAVFSLSNLLVSKVCALLNTTDLVW